MKTVHQTILAGATLLAVAGPVLSAQGKLSWFSDTPFAGVGSVGVPRVELRNPDEYSSFDVNLYSFQRSATENAYAGNIGENSLGVDTVRLYGDLDSSGTQRYASFEDSPNNNRVNAFGVKWQHQLDPINSFALSAEYGEGTAVSPAPLDTLDTRAAFSWTSHLPVSLKPSITGSVFLGDETAREEIYRHLGRRYYGFTVGGSMTVFQSHTPYVSFKMQKSLYDSPEDMLFVSPRSGDRSLLSAGWRWQVQRDFSLQAEASYGLGSNNAPSLDPNNLERSRILFGTRFGFK